VTRRLIELEALSERDRDARRAGLRAPLSAEALDSQAVALLVAEEDGEMRAALPVVKERWPRALPALVTWRHLYSFLGSPLLDGERPGFGVVASPPGSSSSS
jgi:hypothetical protein